MQFSSIQVICLIYIKIVANLALIWILLVTIGLFFENNRELKKDDLNSMNCKRLAYRRHTLMKTKILTKSFTFYSYFKYLLLIQCFDRKIIILSATPTKNSHSRTSWNDATMKFSQNASKIEDIRSKKDMSPKHFRRKFT